MLEAFFLSMLSRRRLIMQIPAGWFIVSCDLMVISHLASVESSKKRGKSLTLFHFELDRWQTSENKHKKFTDSAACVCINSYDVKIGAVIRDQEWTMKSVCVFFLFFLTLHIGFALIVSKYLREKWKLVSLEYVFRRLKSNAARPTSEPVSSLFVLSLRTTPKWWQATAAENCRSRWIK